MQFVDVGLVTELMFTVSSQIKLPGLSHYRSLQHPGIEHRKVGDQSTGDRLKDPACRSLQPVPMDETIKFLTARGVNGLLASIADDIRETGEAECTAKRV